MAGQPDDRALMDAMRRRSGDALEALFKRHAGRVFAVARRILRNESEAEDVLEEVFWELWSRADRFDAGRGSPISYLMLLTRSRALDRLRSLQRRTERVPCVGDLADLESLTSACAPTPSPLEHALLHAQALRVRQALEELRPDQRRALELSFFDGFTHVEISERLGLPLGTVKTHIRRGLGVLRKQLLPASREQEPA